MRRFAGLSRPVIADCRGLEWPIVAEVRIHPHDPDSDPGSWGAQIPVRNHGVTSEILRSATIGAHLAAARSEIASEVGSAR